MSKLELSKEIYKYCDILNTIAEFREFADILVNQNDLYYILDFKSCRFDNIITKKEFENYLIDLSNVKGTEQ